MIDIVEYISQNYGGKIVEVGVGHFFAISDWLEKMGFEVARTDLKKTRHDVMVDDICNPDYEIYKGAELIISVRPPMEIQGCILRLGKKIGCDVMIVPLKNEITGGGRLVNYRRVSFYVFTPQS